MGSLTTPRLTCAAATLVALAAAGAAPAAERAGYAGSSIVGPALVVTLSEGGLGANRDVRYRLVADLAATFDCTLGGTTVPGRTLRAPGLSATATLRAGPDGTLLDHLELDPRDRLDGRGGDELGCRRGWRPGVREIAYTRIRLEDLTGGAAPAPLPAEVRASRVTRPARAPRGG